MALASCSEINTDPAPARPTKSQTVTVNYSLAATSPLSTDTVLVNPKLEVYVVTPATQSDGSVLYPYVATGAVATVTPTTTTQTVTVPAIVVADGQPAPVVRLVFSSDNLPGRRAGAQRITTALYVNSTTTVRATTTYSGLDFARPKAATSTTPATPAPPFRKQTDLGVAIY